MDFQVTNKFNFTLLVFKSKLLYVISKGLLLGISFLTCMEFAEAILTVLKIAVKKDKKGNATELENFYE